MSVCLKLCLALLAGPVVSIVPPRTGQDFNGDDRLFSPFSAKPVRIELKDLSVRERVSPPNCTGHAFYGPFDGHADGHAKE